MFKSIYTIIIILCFVLLNNEQKFDAELNLQSSILNQIFLDDVDTELDTPIPPSQASALKNPIACFSSVLHEDEFLSFTPNYTHLFARAPPYFSA